MNNLNKFVHDFTQKLLTFSLMCVIIYTTKKDNQKSTKGSVKAFKIHIRSCCNSFKKRLIGISLSDVFP